MKCSLSSALAALAAPCLCLSAQAQTPCGGSALQGVVQDGSGALIPGASLVLDGDAAHLFRSGADGRFQLPCVAAGRHRLTVSAANFATAELPVRLPHGALPVTLAVASVEATVEVNGDGPDAVSALGGTGAQTLAGRQLQRLADDPDDLLRELQQMAAAAGGSPGGTTVSVDGFQDSTALPPKSSIAYIKVNPDLFSAEYRNPPYGGGRVEIYTKPGQKAFHGALFTTNGSPFMNARDPFSVSRAALGKQRYGFELAGPVRRTGSDFALTLEHRAIDDFAVVNAVTLDAGGHPVSLVSNVATPQRLWLPTARLDWQLGAKNTFIASYSGSLNTLGNVGAGGTTLPEAAYNSKLNDNTLRVAEVTTVSAKLLHEARASLRFTDENDMPQSLAPQVQVAGAFTGGGATLGAQRIHELRLEVDDDAILSTAHHTLKFGTQFFINRERRRLPTNFNGTYVFGGGTAPVLDANGQPVVGPTTTISGLEQLRRAQLGLAGGAPTAFLNVSGTPEVDFTQTTDALFVQDDWNAGHGLHVAAGMRYYLQNMPVMLNGATPRLGLLYAPGKDPKWTVNAHAGLFTGTIGPSEEAEILREDGTARVTSTVYNPVYGQPFGAGATAIRSLRTIAPGFSNLSYSSFSVGGSRELPGHWNLSASYNYGRLWNLKRSNNVNAPLTDQPTGPRPGAADLNVLQVQNSGQGRVDIEFVELEQHSYKRLQLSVGGVHVLRIDDTGNDVFFTPQNAHSDAGEFARTTQQPVWQLFGNASLSLPRKVQLSLDFYAAEGAGYNITTGFDNNGDGDFNDRPQFAQEGTPGAVRTPYGLLVSQGGTGVLGRNLGRMPWVVHLDANLQRSWKLTRNSKAEHQQTVTANLRSSNLPNHTNVTAIGGVLGSPLFNVPYAADNGRRVEVGLRYSF